MRTHSFESEKRSRAVPRLSAARWIMAAVWIAGISVALSVARGMSMDGLAFLGELAPLSGPIIAGLLCLALLLAVGSAYVLLKRERLGGPKGLAYRYPASARLTALAVLVSYVPAALVLVAGVLQFDVVNAGMVTRGELGVAVAEFTPLAGGRELSALVARSLRQKLGSLPDLAGHVAVISAPPFANHAQASAYAKQNGVQIVIWGRGAGAGNSAFVPSVTFIEPPSFQVWYGDIPAPREAQLTGEGGVELSQTLAGGTPALADYVTGLIYLSRGDGKQAAARLQQAVGQTLAEAQIGPPAGQGAGSARTLAVFRLALARTLADLGDPARARTEYQQVLKEDPEYAAAYVGLGNIDYRQRDCQAALSAYQQAVQIDPLLPAAWYSAGNARFCLGRFDEAAKDYQQAAQLAQPNSEARDLYGLMMGVALCGSGRTKQGIDQLALARSGNLVRAAEAEADNCLKMMSTPGTVVRVPAPAASPTPTAASLSPLLSELLQFIPFRGPTATPVPTPSRTPTPLQSPTETEDATITPRVVIATPAATTATTVATETPLPGPLPAAPIATDVPAPTSVPPTTAPTQVPSPLPTSIPATPVPTAAPSPLPTSVPPTAVPTLAPSPVPTGLPPTAAPTLAPSPLPTSIPPTAVPTLAPTPMPTDVPPTAAPTPVPATAAPTSAPTVAPMPTSAPPPTAAPEPTSAPAPTAVESLKPRPGPPHTPGPPPPRPTHPPKGK